MKALLAMAFMLAQAPPAFDVASVKRDVWPGNGFVGVRVRGDTLEADHLCLTGLVSYAYNLREGHLSGGPSWAQCGRLDLSELYQVIAKTTIEPPPPMEQFRLMLQTLLADRFQLQVHHVQRELPTYNLVVAPRGPKLKESAPDAKRWMNQYSHGTSARAVATHYSMADLVANFEGYAGRPLFDRTGLTGSYDFEIEWDAEAGGSGLAEALQQQLGLRLESGTGSFDTVVIDRAERPSGN